MKKLDELETTTVWILPEKDFEKHLNKNVIDRYSKSKSYSTIIFGSHYRDEMNFSKRKRQKDNQLLFIKSPFWNNVPSRSNIEDYLEGIKGIIDRELSNLNKNGFVVIQTMDVRIDGYIEPLAKRIVDMLTYNNLWLKEIVVVTHNGADSVNQNSKNYLKITHQYLIIYEVRK